MKNKLTIENVLKVADVYQGQISWHTQDFLKDYVTFRDTKLREDIISIEDAQEAFSIKRFGPGSFRRKVELELLSLQRLLAKNDCAYLRIVNM